MKKKFLLALSLIAILMVIFAISVSAAEPVETWDISATSSDSVTAYLCADPQNSGMYTLTISGTGDMKNWISYSSVPWYSSYSSKITSVTIEDGVTSIGYYAFYECSNLTSIVIPEGVTSIGNWVFYECSNLTSIVIPEGVTSIGSSAFHECSSLTSVVIPDSVTSIGSSAFHECSSLTSIVIPDSVSSIGIYAFFGCSNLASIVIPDGVTSIGNGAFSWCENLTSIVIPEGVTSIGSGAFSDCSSLTSVVIPEGITSIGNYAFNGCSKLTIYAEAENQPSGWNTDWNSSNCPVVWGHTHTYDNKTDSCICGTKISYVEKWDISKSSSDSVTAYLCADPQNSGMYTLTISGTGYMENWDWGSSPWYFSYGSKITYVTIEEGVTNVGNRAFSGCSSLTSIVIPEGVTSIGDYAFYGCSSLASIVIPEGVTSIGDFAFHWCYSLTSIVIPDGVTSICDWAFSYCSSLTSIVIPEGVTSIGYGAFSYCSNLASIVIPDSVTSIVGSAFSGCSNLIDITVNDGNTNYKSIDGNLYSYDGKTLIQYAVGKSNEAFTIPDGVTNIGNEAFYKCSNLTSIVIPDSVTSIGINAFFGCSSLTSIVIPDSVTSIGGEAFSSCSNLTSIVIPEGVTSIGYGAFQYCSRLANIIVNESNQAYKSIDGNLYSYDGKTLIQYAVGKSNEAFTIPDGVTSIGDRAFYGCSNLASIVIPDSVTSIGSFAFSNCSSLTSIVIPEGVTSIGDCAFQWCSKLTIYAEAESQPSGWDTNWDPDGRPVVWGYFDEEACLNAIFTFKGYSFNESGSMAVGFDIDYEALAKYEEKTGKSLEIGVVFAGYDSLEGFPPLDETGNAVLVENGFVVKFDITPYNYLSYDFVITDIDEAMADTALVISAYIYNGENVKYVQENGLSDTVTGISYNQAQTK